MTSIPNAQFIAQDIAAKQIIDRGAAAPTLANQLACRELLPLGKGIRQFRAQIKISAHALTVRTAKAEDRFRMRQVDGEFHFAAPDKTAFVEIGNFDG